MGLSHAMTLAQAGIDLSQQPSLPPETNFGDLLKYGEIGLEVMESLELVKTAPVGAEGSAPPIKTDVGNASFTLLLHWIRTR